LHFCNYLPFDEDLVLNLNNLEFPWLKDNLYQVWLKLVRWFWRRRFLKIFSVFLLFPYYLPLEWGVALHMNKSESPLPKDNLCQLWLQLAKRFWIDWLFTVLRPAQEFFTYIETSPLPVKGWKVSGFYMTWCRKPPRKLHSGQTQRQIDHYRAPAIKRGPDNLNTVKSLYLELEGTEKKFEIYGFSRYPKFNNFQGFFFKTMSWCYLLLIIRSYGHYTFK
jgi:hypothetical protein